jgi:hypothetical protein
MAGLRVQIGERQSHQRRAGLPPWANLSSTRRGAGETLASPGDPVAQLALIVPELDFCVPERAGTRPALNDTDEMDDLRSSASPSAWHSCFACASDTLVISGQLVADPGDAYAPGRIG